MYSYEEAYAKYKAAVKKFVDLDAIEAAVAKFYDVDTFKANMSKLYDAEAYKKMYDMEALKENLSKFYDVEAAKAYFEKTFKPETAKEFYAKLMDMDAVKAVKEAFEKASSKTDLTDMVEKNLKLASDLIKTNTDAVADAIILQSSQFRESVESALKQASELSKVKDFKVALEAQKDYAKATTSKMKEMAWSNVGIATKAVEANVALLKGAYAKPVIKKAPIKRAVKKAASATKEAAAASA